MGCERVDGAIRGTMSFYHREIMPYTTCQALEKNEKKNTVRARRSNVERRFICQHSDSDRDQQFYLRGEISIITSINFASCPTLFRLAKCVVEHQSDLASAVVHAVETHVLAVLQMHSFELCPRGPVPRSCCCRKIRFKFQPCTYRWPHINSSLLTGSSGRERMHREIRCSWSTSCLTERHDGCNVCLRHGGRVLFCGVLDEVYFRKRKNGRTRVEGDVLSRRRIIIVTETKVSWLPKGTTKSSHSFIRNVLTIVVIVMHNMISNHMISCAYTTKNCNEYLH
ncbi:hypothetical protein ALC60_04237 [Trachymyrmex zeteki]|uniref:Uncharacterized protein n=1 Tax=Mycetomoellerius zeteki TaxID=64791 RepID=A0A151X8M5_9HYME|nr:hypothetical protein ALC60_04237 [Trachymyrmex zeteki]